MSRQPATYDADVIIVGTGNPTLTIAALALRAAPEIEGDLAVTAP